MRLENLTQANLKLENAKRTMQRQATRVNKPQLAHAIAYESDKANHSTKGKTEFLRVIREAGAAAPITHGTLKNPATYVTGDGDYKYTQRPGSEDFLKYRSLGI